MKKKKVLAMLLLGLMMFAAVGTMAGCGGNDGGDDKQVETQGKTDDKKDAEEAPKATATPEPTSTPTPTATPMPEVLPTAEELFDANEDMFDGKMKMSTQFAYKIPTEYGEMDMSMDAVMLRYDDITYERSESTISLLDITETISSEAYYVDDKDSAIRTEYSFDSENEVWVKYRYVYIALDEDDFPVDEMKDVEVSQDDAFYYVTGVLDDAESMGDVDSFGMEGFVPDTMSCTFKFDKTTKNIMAVEIVYKFDIVGMGEEIISVDDYIAVFETLEEPVVIPEEVLAAEPDMDLWED